MTWEETFWILYGLVYGFFAGRYLPDAIHDLVDAWRRP